MWQALDATKAIAHFIDGRSLEQFLGDLMLRSAVERQCEIIGEAFSRLGRISPETAARLPEWRDAIDFRNLIAHGYDAVDPTRIWRTVTGQVPTLARRLEAMLQA